MTKEPCSYCGGHHVFREVETLVCDYARPLYPLPDNGIEKKEAIKIAENHLLQEIKVLKNDCIILNSQRAESIAKLKMDNNEKDLRIRELEAKVRELYSKNKSLRDQG